MVFIKGGDVNALLGYKLKLNFPPAIPLELLMRARCALVLYSDSFSDRSLFLGGYSDFKSHTTKSKPPPCSHIYEYSAQNW
jgi:hypothetical protein